MRDYPFRGLGKEDYTLDLDPAMEPNFLQDARDPLPDYTICDRWPAILIDRPYTPEDAAHYKPGADKLPAINDLVKRSLAAVRPGGRVGVLDYFIPRPPKTARFIACVGVIVGFGNRGRFYTVFQRGE